MKNTVSKEMKMILIRLKAGEDVSIEQIKRTEEIRDVERKIRVLENLNGESYQISPQELIYKALLLLGQDDSIERKRRLDIVIGPPASGKSSLIVDKVAKRYHSRVIDNDIYKQMLPLYCNGIGASYVHLASKAIESYVFVRAIDQGDNIVFPKLGCTYQKLLTEYIDTALYKRYYIYIHYVETSRRIATLRCLTRFLQTGRYVPLSVLFSCYQNDGHCIIEDSYNIMKGLPSVSGFSKWNSDSIGVNGYPYLIETQGDIDIYLN